MCAGDPNAIKDTCQVSATRYLKFVCDFYYYFQGDSGGPLQVKQNVNGKNVFFLIGVTSFGRACAVETPGVYTRISYYLDWIEKIVWPTNQKGKKINHKKSAEC